MIGELRLLPDDKRQNKSQAIASIGRSARHQNRLARRRLAIIQ
ncbi:MAG: hypothetical protein ACR65R_10535 [Methylomicrobium sp.]